MNERLAQHRGRKPSVCPNDTFYRTLTYASTATVSTPRSSADHENTSKGMHSQPPRILETKGTQTANVMPRKCHRGTQTDIVGISARDALLQVLGCIPAPFTVTPRPDYVTPFSISDVDKEHEARMEAEKQWQERMEGARLKHTELIKIHRERLAAL